MDREANSRTGRGGLLPKLLSGVLAFGLVAGSLSPGLLRLSLEKWQVKRAVKRHVLHDPRSHVLVRLQFTREEARTLLRWEHPREFEYAGEMYDVVEVREIGDALHLLCWRDHEETRLNREMRALAARESEGKPRIGPSRDPLAGARRAFCRLFPAVIPIEGWGPSFDLPRRDAPGVPPPASPPPTPPPESV